MINTWNFPRPNFPAGKKLCTWLCIEFHGLKQLNCSSYIKEDMQAVSITEKLQLTSQPKYSLSFWIQIS